MLRRQFIGTYMDSDNVSYDTRGSQGLRLQEVAPGVHHVVGGTHNSLLVEMSDHLIVFDAPVTDARGRQVIAYHMESPHAKGTLMGWVPDAKLGFVTDIWTPGPPLPAKPNPGLLSIVNAVKKIGIQPERFAGGHGTTADYASLARLAGQ